MKHTPESLAAMSDKEINAELVKVLGIPHKVDNQGVFIDLGSKYGVVYCSLVDYCNNPSDVMSLVFENRISLIENDVGYTAYHNFSIFEDINYRIEHGAYFGDTNPLRAAACCLILVLQEKK